MTTLIDEAVRAGIAKIGVNPGGTGIFYITRIDAEKLVKAAIAHVLDAEPSDAMLEALRCYLPPTDNNANALRYLTPAVSLIDAPMRALKADLAVGE